MIRQKNTQTGRCCPIPFDGIVLTDTFQLYEQEKDMVADLMPDNSERRTKQKARDIRVIMGNPPYSAGNRARMMTQRMLILSKFG